MKVIQVKVAHLTSECWIVQLQGLSACKKCELRNTYACGGKGIILSGKNKKGFKVPLKKQLDK